MMKLEWPWKAQKITLEKDLHTLEEQLDAVFRPVEPRTSFTKDLREQLVGKAKREKFNLNWESPKFRTGLLVAGGVVSFFAMLITGIRIISAFVGIRQLSMQDKKPARV